MLHGVYATIVGFSVFLMSDSIIVHSIGYAIIMQVNFAPIFTPFFHYYNYFPVQLTRFLGIGCHAKARSKRLHDLQDYGSIVVQSLHSIFPNSL